MDCIRVVIDVVVGLIEDEHGRILVSQRVPGAHMAGHWEFPGGKRRPREDRFAALRRELREALEIEIREAAPFMRLSHDYADRRVLLDVWNVTDYEGIPRSAEGQRLLWLTVGELATVGLLSADMPIVDRLRRRGVNSTTI